MRFARQRAWVRTLKARRREYVGVVLLVVATLRGRVREVWVGDSHSVTFNSGRPPLPGILRIDGGRWVWHLGPRVMFSVARDGLPPTLHRVARLLARLPGRRDVPWLFSFGEIDIRCHLGPRLGEGADVAFVAAYVDRVRALLDDAGARGVVVVPVPPSKDTLDHALFPVAGSIEERLAAHAAVRRALHDAVAATPGLQVLDATEELAGASGLMEPSLTDDRCHTNEAGRLVVRRQLDRLRST